MTTNDLADYLTVSARNEQCVWCHREVPAGTPLELMVAHHDRRWWSCAPCAAEARTPRHHQENP